MSRLLLNAEQLEQELFSRLDLAKSTSFYLALSGGQDSCVLLDLMCQLAQKQTIDLTLLHFDHGLQAQSQSWSKHCEQLANRYAVPILIQREIVQVDPKQGLEASARKARYAWFAEVIEQRSAEKGKSKGTNQAVLLTAHHANDQAETLLLNLMRGTGVTGLRGIARKKASENYTLVRPLLDFDQQQITGYAEQQRLHWIDDPSNEEQRFRRNAIRKNVLPTLNSMKHDAVQQFVKSAEHMVNADKLLADLAKLDLKTVQLQSYNPLDKSYGISLHDLKQLGEDCGLERQANVLRHWLQQQGYALSSQSGFQQLLDWANHGTADKNELRNGEYVYRTYRENLFVMPFVLPIKASADQVWHDLNQAFALSIGGNKLNVYCKDLDKAKQYKDVQVLFANEAREQFSLKKRFQGAAIPHWCRDITPILLKEGKIVGIVGSRVSDWLVIE